MRRTLVGAVALLALLGTGCGDKPVAGDERACVLFADAIIAARTVGISEQSQADRLRSARNAADSPELDRALQALIGGLEAGTGPDPAAEGRVRAFCGLG